MKDSYFQTPDGIWLPEWTLVQRAGLYVPMRKTLPCTCEECVERRQAMRIEAEVRTMDTVARSVLQPVDKNTWLALLPKYSVYNSDGKHGQA